MRIDRIDESNLLGPRTGTAWSLAGFGEVGAGGRELKLDLVPNRCDAHAVAENKAGTLFAVVGVLGDGRNLRFFLPLNLQQEGGLLEYVAAHCGFGEQ